MKAELQPKASAIALKVSQLIHSELSKLSEGLTARESHNLRMEMREYISKSLL